MDDTAALNTSAELEKLSRLAQELGVRLSTPQATTLLLYLDLLERWNATYNLTAVRSREGMWTQHLADCLAIIAPLQSRASEMSGGRVLDVGSGGGLPGVVIATCLPELTVTCVDAVAKKAAFVRQVMGQLGLIQLRAVHARVEDLKDTSFDLIVSRAFASLADFVTLTRGALAPQGLWLAMKGKTPGDEMAALPKSVTVFHVEHLRIPGLDAERCLVWMRRTEGPH